MRAKMILVDNELPDIDSKDVQDATLKIQSCYRGFKTRKQLENKKQKGLKKKKSKSSSDSEMETHSSDSSDTESDKVMKQSSHRKAEKRARKVVSRVPESSATESDAMESLPETDTDIENSKRLLESSATESEGENLSDMEDSDSEIPARKNKKDEKEFKKKKRRVDDILISAIIIQRSYRRYKKRKENRKKAAIAYQQQKLSEKLQRGNSQVKLKQLL